MNHLVVGHLVTCALVRGYETLESRCIPPRDPVRVMFMKSTQPGASDFGRCHMSYGLNSLMGGSIGDCIGDYYRAY